MNLKKQIKSANEQNLFFFILSVYKMGKERHYRNPICIMFNLCIIYLGTVSNQLVNIHTMRT